jgi:hypothetical protein
LEGIYDKLINKKKNMKNIEILKKVADLVGFTFSSTHNFAEVELEGGLMISNQTEGDFMVGDVVSVKNEDGTYTIVGAGEHNLLDGRMFITDEEGKLVEIREVEEPEVSIEVETEEMEKIEVEVPSGEMTPDMIEKIVEVLTPIVEEMKVLSEEMKKLKKDYEGFKASSAYAPLNEDKVVSNAFKADYRYQVLQQLKAQAK